MPNTIHTGLHTPNQVTIHNPTPFIHNLRKFSADGETKYTHAVRKESTPKIW